MALCPPHTVSITMALQYNMKSGMAISPVVLVLFKTSLDICGLLCLHMYFKILLPISVKSGIRILIGVALNTQIAFCRMAIFALVLSSP